MLDIKIKNNQVEVKKEETTPPPVEVKDTPVSVHESEHNEKEHAKVLEQRKLKQKKTKKVVMILLGVTLFFALTTVALLYEVYVLKKLASADELLHPDVPVTPAQIMEAVSHHLLLPTGTPQIATVQDAKKLSTSQAFFKDALNGDVVLVYDSMIVLYRPTKDILVAVGDITGVVK